MKNVIKAIVYALIALTVIFYGGAYMLPGESNVSRSIIVAAPPGKVFAIAGDLRQWPMWSPWLQVDPATAFTFEGTERGGKGQKMRWASNNPLVGNGTATVTIHEPDGRVAFAMDYGEFGGVTSTMDFAASGDGTAVTWTFHSALPGVVDRWAGLLIDRQVGAEYDVGLSRLKALAESSPDSN